MLEFKTTFLEDVQSINWISSSSDKAERNEERAGCQPAKLPTVKEKCDVVHLGQPVPA